MIDLSLSWQVHRGDALRLLLEVPDGSVDLVLTDPPYSSGGQFRGDRVGSTANKYVGTGVQLERPDFAGDARDQRAYEYWCSLWFGEVLRVLRPGAICCAFCDWRQVGATQNALQSGGLVMRGLIAWDKTEGVRPQLGRFRQQAEFVVWGSAGPMDPDRNPVVLPGVIRCARGKGEALRHQTGKPVPLLRELVRAAPPGGVVLDPFAGSATTGLAALREGRRFCGFELTAEYSEMARQVLEAEALGSSLEAAQAGQTPLFGG